MASGLPIVSYDEGGHTDFLEDGKTGSVVALNDRTAFTRAVYALVQDHARREEMGHENLRRVEDYFIESCARSYEQVFQGVLLRRME